ncbi:hypothetical protein ARMSODRAFT_943112 [Armillaria solidipes]|uniref:Heterokaryon incompatibility domain-containing protein n=1 Tax=Armillaria solidipes TaxID=1076256 RepID=A0A2H3B8Y5_9AGAR|nr:hypothetical protein ARMSODRAFT_943112 [Armillaria solidipes]
MRNTPLEVIGRFILCYIQSIWELLLSIFSTSATMKDSPLDTISNSEQNANIIACSESQGEIPHPNGNSAIDGGTSSEAIHASLSNFDPQPPSESLGAGSENVSVDVRPSSDSQDTSGDSDTSFFNSNSWVPKNIAFPKVTISALTETGQAESSIKVPLQRSYTGRRPVIPSSLANTPCATLGIQGLLDELNTTLGTSYTLDIPSLSSILEDCVKKCDFGTAYGRLCWIWYTHDWSNIRDELRRHGEEDMVRRQEALVGNRIVNPRLPPRRVWDLYSNRVVPSWTVSDEYDLWEVLKPMSHAWVDEEDHMGVWTPINGYKWPVPIPNGTSLDLIRIEMLNLGLQYTWLDVLCLRQKGGLKEDLHVEEWMLDVPTIGWVYSYGKVVIYLSGLGLPLSVKEGGLDSERCWFRRAWTLQEVGRRRIIAGDMPDGPMSAKPIDEDGNYETELLTRFHKQLGSTRDGSIFSRLAEMRLRVSTNHVDKVAGLAFPLSPDMIPAYHESESLEDAWTALVNAMSPGMRVSFLLLYPGVGLGCKKWRPTWEQVMTAPLPLDQFCYGFVKHDDKTDEDLFEEHCIKKGRVLGLSADLAEGGDRCGQLIVEGTDGMPHTFTIRATHQIPILEDMYMLLGISAIKPKDGTWQQHWAVGRCLPGHRFEKVSVVVMDDEEDVKRLKGLGIVNTESCFILV